MKRKRLELKRADHSGKYPLGKLEWGTCCRDDAHGVVVKEFQRKVSLKDGPGYRAGLRDNDVIVAFGPDGEIHVESSQQARTYFSDAWDAGAQSIWVTVQRDEESSQKRKGADLKAASLKERADETAKRAGRAGGKDTRLSLRERLTPACVKRPRSPPQPPPPVPKPPAKPQHHPEFLALLKTYQTLDNIWREGPKLAEWGSRAESFPQLPQRRTGRLKKVGPPAASVQAPEDERPHYQADWDQVTFAFHMPDDHGNRTLFPDEHHDLLWVGHSVDIQVVTQFCALMERELRERLRSEWGEVLLPEPFAMGPGVELPSLRRKPKPKNSFLILRLGMGAASGHFVLLYANHENPKKKTVFVVDSLMTYTMGSEYANEYVGHVRKAAAALMRARPNDRFDIVWLDTPQQKSGLDSCGALACFYLYAMTEAIWPHELKGEKVSQMMRHRHLLLTYPRFAYFARLTQEYVVDMYVRMEENRLRWVRFNQKQLRMGSREELIAALGEDAPYQPGRVFLPTSFIGGPRHMDKIYRDSMRIVTRLGSPNFFITFTCNPKWPDIVDTEDTVMIARVFKAQLDELLALIRSQKVFKGDLTYLTGVIEWQKRGLPHCHLVLKKDHEMTMEYIDSVVCAEIPSEPHLRDLAKAHMLHGPHQAGAKYPAPCEDPDTHRCTKNYPKAFTPETYTDERGFVQYRRRDIHRGQTMKGGKSLPYDNSWVVPFNKVLLETFQAHINVEVCSTAHVIKYLFKYMTKGGDQSLVAVVGSGGSGGAGPPSAAPAAGPGPLIQPPGGAAAAAGDAQGGNVPGVRDQVVDEIKNFQSARWIGANQAAWRILGFPIQFKSVAVLALCIHLEGRDQLIFDPSNPTGALERQSQLSRYLNRPLGQEFADLTYVDYYESFVEYRTDVDESIPHPGGKFWVRERKRGVMVCRIYWVSPNLGEIFYLRLLLIHFPARSYKELRTVRSVEYETFQEACKAHGLIEHTQEQLKVLRAADEEGFHGPALRHLFLILTLGQGLPAKIIWDNGKDLLAQDFLHDKARGWDKDWAYNEALKHLTRLLSAHGKTLDSLNLPACRDDSTEVERERERWVAEDQGTFRDYWEPKLTPEQSQVYQTLLQAVESQRGAMARKTYMLDALAGSGKTLVLQVLTAALRARGHVVLVCASTGIAAQNHMGGTTAHSLFGIPIDDPDGKGVCSVTNGTQRAALIRSASLIIIDELLMLHRYAVRSINRLLDDVGFRVQPIVVGAGDFRQCAPVVKWGSREDVVKASPKFARNWAQVHQLSLSKNMRAAADPEYAAFVKAVGEDTVPPVDFPNDSGDPNLFTPLRLIATVPDINKLIQFVFPDLTDSYTNVKRGILSGTNDTIDAINSMILERLPGGTEVKLSADKARTDEGDALHVETETLNALNEVGNPPHRLPLKVGAVVMISRNLNQAAGLVNSTKAIIRAIQPKMVIVEVPPTPTKGGRLFPIPRITFQFQPGGKGAPRPPHSVPPPTRIRHHNNEKSR